MPNPNKPSVKLERWSVVDRVNRAFLYPDAPDAYLQGDVSGHPRFLDGTFVYTSYIIDADIQGRFVETNNTNYTLGAVDPVYIRWLINEGVNPFIWDLMEPRKGIVLTSSTVGVDILERLREENGGGARYSLGYSGPDVFIANGDLRTLADWFNELALYHEAALIKKHVAAEASQTLENAALGEGSPVGSTNAT